MKTVQEEPSLEGIPAAVIDVELRATCDQYGVFFMVEIEESLEPIPPLPPFVDFVQHP
jgi:hypothetical protein